MRNLRALLFLLISVGSAGAFEVGDLELVYTPPVETTLQNPDLRPPARVWLELFRSAKRTIDIEQMYAVSREGEPLEGVIDALEEAARRGVKVRFLLEKKMKRASEPSTLERLRRIPDLELVLVDFAKILGKDAIIHAKFIVVDGRRAYLGSQNFDWRSLKHVHELGVRIADPTIAGRVQAIFEHDWRAATGDGAPPRPTAKPALSEDPIRLVASPPELLPDGVGPSERELPRLLGRAKKEVRAQVMSYNAREGHGDKRYATIDDALRAAALRGVKVKLLVANWSTGHPNLDDLRALAREPNVEIKVVTLPEAKEGFIPYARVIHSKYAVLDGATAWIGTSNWEGGYLNRLRNLELVVGSAPFADRVRKLHEQLWTSPYAAPLRLEGDYPKPRKAE